MNTRNTSANQSLLGKEGKDFSTSCKWKSILFATFVILLIVLLVFHNNNLFAHKSLKSENISTASPDFNYISRNLFTSEDLETPMAQYFGDDVVFYLANGEYTKQEMIDVGYDFNEIFGFNAIRSNLQFSTIIKPKYTVEWAFGMRTNLLDDNTIDNVEEQNFICFST